MQRYHWIKPSGLPDRIELIDAKMVNRSVAVIAFVSPEWCWQRSTSWLIHGVPSAEGVCSTLQQAKNQVVNGLPNEWPQQDSTSRPPGVAEHYFKRLPLVLPRWR